MAEFGFTQAVVVIDGEFHEPGIAGSYGPAESAGR